MDLEIVVVPSAFSLLISIMFCYLTAISFAKVVAYG